MRWLALLVIVLLAFGTAFIMADSSATITWTDPTTNTDGTPLTDLAGLRVYRDGAIIDTVLPGVQSYADTALPNGTHCYEVTAFDTSSNESIPSNQACKTIDALFPSAPGNLSIQ